MPRTSPNVPRLGQLGLGYFLLASTLALAPACSIGTDPALPTDGGAAIPPGGDAGLEDANTGSRADGGPAGDAAPDLPYDRPPIDELTYPDVEVATFALG